MEVACCSEMPAPGVAEVGGERWPLPLKPEGPQDTGMRERRGQSSDTFSVLCREGGRVSQREDLSGGPGVVGRLWEGGWNEQKLSTKE